MKYFLIILYLFFFQITANATVIETGISIEEVPKALFGSWRVSAVLEKTNARTVFKPQSIDFWNLSRVNDRVKLDNPFSGANAEISVQTVENNLIVFSKQLPYDGNKVLTDTVTIRINENKFEGLNHLRLETFSRIDNHLLKTQTATYRINGEKIAGDSIMKNQEIPE